MNVIDNELRVDALRVLLVKLADTLDLRGYDVALESKVNSRNLCALTLHLGWDCAEELLELVKATVK